MNADKRKYSKVRAGLDLRSFAFICGSARVSFLSSLSWFPLPLFPPAGGTTLVGSTLFGVYFELI